MGYGATRTLERVAAAMGSIAEAPIVFESAQDIPQGGVRLALPALLAGGLLRYSPELYSLPAGFYGLSRVFLRLALMALARIPSLEQLRYVAAGEWGNLLGLDRIPEVRTWREKLKLLCKRCATKCCPGCAPPCPSRQSTRRAGRLTRGCRAAR